MTSEEKESAMYKIKQELNILGEVPDNKEELFEDIEL